jgi:hypothetical protein
VSDEFALTYLFDSVSKQFADDETHVENLFGWQAPTQKLVTGNRIAWVPGGPTGSLGGMGPAKMPGRNPRPLATLHELCTVYIQGDDPREPTNERLQYAATRLIYDAWYRAIFKAYTSRVEVISADWLIEKTQFRFGTCIRAVLQLDAMIADLPVGIAPVNTTATISVDVLDVTETFVATPEEAE